MRVLHVLIVTSVLIALGAIFPRYTQEDDNFMLEKYNQIQNEILANGTALPFPVMSFNMRLDTFESDPNNHFTKRIFRIDELFRKWNPYIIGLQEPLGGQLLHLKSVIPKYYKAVGYNRNSFDSGHPSRINDFNVAILYDDRVMKLMESDFMWLSKTPRRDQSKDWGSGGIRALNIARFRMMVNGVEGKQDFVVFNTHLDRWGELARREQSKLILSTIREWIAKYPDAIILLFGDFNTGPGQAAHVTLTSELTDAWVWCKDNSAKCIANNFAASFHGFQGAIANTYLARILSAIVFTFHGMGVAPPFDKATWSDVFHDFIFKPFPLSEAIPPWPFDRLHVDWVLFAQGSTGGKATGEGEKMQVPAHFEPQLVAVADVRSANYSSDHFPIVALFSLDKSRV